MHLTKETAANPTLDPIVLAIGRDEVERQDLSLPLSLLGDLVADTEIAKLCIERLDVCFGGYDNDPEELFEIPSVRNYVGLLDAKFPYWLLFLSKRHLGLDCILRCLVPPFLKPDAMNERVAMLLEQRWFPAMNAACTAIGYTDLQIEAMTDRSVRYITEGRFPLDSPRGG